MNSESGQWGTNYDDSRDIGRAPLEVSTNAQPVEEFTISVQPTDAHHGYLILDWGSFRWRAPIIVE